jgi:hypothetical protein
LNKIKIINNNEAAKKTRSRAKCVREDEGTREKEEEEVSNYCELLLPVQQQSSHIIKTNHICNLHASVHFIVHGILEKVGTITLRVRFRLGDIANSESRQELLQ